MKSDPTKTAENYQVLKPYDFLADLEQEVERAKKRVWVQAMFFDSGSVMSRLSHSMQVAAALQLDVRLHADWYSLKFSDGPMLRKGSKKYQQKQKMFDDLSNSGIAVTVTNPPSWYEHFFPYAGRNHMKMTIIDDIAYLGGVNFGDRDFDLYDFMVKITDQSIVESLATIFMATENLRLKDQIIPLNQNNALILDSGSIGRSLILKQAVAAVQQAKDSVFHTSQFLPDGAFLRTLVRLHKKQKRIEIIAPTINDFNFIIISVYYFGRLFFNIRARGLKIVFTEKIVHAKLTIIDQQKVIIGSHNLTSHGVRIGTAEIALMSSDKRLVSNLVRYYDDLKQEIHTSA